MRARVKEKINWELFDTGMDSYTWFTLEELAKGAQRLGLMNGASHGEETARFAEASVKSQRDLGKDRDRPALQKPFQIETLARVIDNTLKSTAV